MRRDVFTGALLTVLGAAVPVSGQHGSVQTRLDLRPEFAGCAMCHETHAATRTAYTLRITALPLAIAGGRGSEPDPVSRSCLRCHLTPELRSRQPELRSGTAFPDSRGYLGSDLEDDHPVGRVERDDLAAALVDPAGGPGSRPPAAFRSMRSRGLEREEHVACSTCHDPHARDGDVAGPEILAVTCSGCHASGRYALGAHMSLVCGDCHRIHGGGRPLLAETMADALCSACHDSSGIPLGRHASRAGLPHAPAGHDGTRATGCLTCHGAHE